MAGQFCGDAYGAQFEFKSTKQILAHVGPEYRTMGGSYTWPTAPGQITDDSEMAVALINSIIEGAGYFDTIARKHYVQWYNSGPFDMGNTTARALGASAKPDRESQANGAMMRISPLAVFHARKLMMADDFSLKELDGGRNLGRIYHPPQLFVRRGQRPLFKGARAINFWGTRKSIMKHLEAGIQHVTNPSLGQAITMGRKDMPEDVPGKSGWVLIALHNAIYRFMNCDSRSRPSEKPL